MSKLLYVYTLNRLRYQIYLKLINKGRWSGLYIESAIFKPNLLFLGMRISANEKDYASTDLCALKAHYKGCLLFADVDLSSRCHGYTQKEFRFQHRQILGYELNPRDIE